MTDHVQGNHLDLLGGSGTHLTVGDAATRAGEMIAAQVRSVTEATEAHARTIVEEAQRDAREVMGSARYEANRVREQVDAIADMLEALLRDLQRDADHFGHLLSPGDFYGGDIVAAPAAPELHAGDEDAGDEDDGDAVEPTPEAEASPTPPEPEPESEDELASLARELEPDVEDAGPIEPEAAAEAEPEAEAEKPAGPEVEEDRPRSRQRRRFARDDEPAHEDRPTLSVVEAETAEEWYAAVTDKSDSPDAPCAHCGTGGGCARCRGRGRRFGMRCPDCHGTGICPRCRGQGYVWASNRPRSAM